MLQYCCSLGDKSPASAYRVAISHFIIYLALIATYFCLGVEFDETSLAEPTFIQQLLFMAAGFNILPWICSILLLTGIKKHKLHYVRLWITAAVIITIILFLLFVGGTVYFITRLSIYYDILLCFMPVVLVIWMMESLMVVNGYYKSEKEIEHSQIGVTVKV